MNAQAGGEAGAIRVVLADGRTKVLSALRFLLEQDGGLMVSSQATTAGELLEQVKDSCPDAILLDCDLPGPRASELLPQLRSICPQTQVVALCSRPDLRRAALTAGADAFFCKTESPEKLLEVLRECLAAAGTRKPMD